MKLILCVFKADDNLNYHGHQWWTKNYVTFISQREVINKNYSCLVCIWSLAQTVFDGYMLEILDQRNSTIYAWILGTDQLCRSCNCFPQALGNICIMIRQKKL